MRWRLLVAIVVAGLAAADVARGSLDLRSGGEEDRLVTRLESSPVTVFSDQPVEGGVTGARRLALRFEDGVEIEVKWKPVPSGMDGFNHSPRKGIAAYQVQRLVLDPPDHPIPTTVLRCIPIESFGDALRPESNPEGSACVLGEAELWLHDVHCPKRIYEPEHFARDPVYAGHVADLNLVTYLIDHRDGRSNNFLASNDPSGRRVYSIDNGIAFDPILFNYFVRNWNSIRVPALRRAPIERLRSLAPGALDSLAVGVEMRRGVDGIFRHAPRTAPRAPGAGVFFDGETLQLGLTASEIEHLRERIAELLEDVDGGDLRLF